MFMALLVAIFTGGAFFGEEKTSNTAPTQPSLSVNPTPTISLQPELAVALQPLDINKDGVVNKEELVKRDVNKDGNLSIQELGLTTEQFAALGKHLGVNKASDGLEIGKLNVATTLNVQQKTNETSSSR